MDNTSTVERVGNTVEDAVADALRILETSEDQVDIEVLDPGSKGVLGIFGQKPARVRVSVRKKSGPDEVIQKFLGDVFTAMGLDVKLEITQNEKHISVNLVGENMGILIGKRGGTLDSLQYLTNLTVNRGGVPEFSVTIDTENYRKRRKETLESLALSLARKAKSTRKNVVLEPMTRYERHVIHTILQKDPGVRTYSDGNEPYRNIIIAPNRNASK